MPHSPSLCPTTRHPWEEAFSTAAASAAPRWPWHLSISHLFLPTPPSPAPAARSLARSPVPPFHVCQSWLVYTGSSSRQKSDGIHPNPPPVPPPAPHTPTPTPTPLKKKIPPKKKSTTNLHVGPTARDPALLTEVGGGGCMTKTTACVEEHCLRLWLEIFSGKNRILYTIVVGVKKGGTY